MMKRLLLALSVFFAAAGSLAGGAMGSPATSSSAVAVHSSRFGRILYDGRGFVLYAFTKDPSGRSVCTGACASAWPPYIVKSKPAALAGAKGKLLGTTRRADRKLQATYAGRPLYYYIGDRSPGEILCQNVSQFGGVWQVVRVNGRVVRSS
jgi:predicted lipoprotein with Yx(FWY)xxD motif